MQPATDIFPVRFRQARAIARRSLRELASDLHVSHTLLNRYETGAAKPVASMLLKIADALGVAPDFFFRREQPALQEIRFRKKSALGAREKRSIEERAKDFFSRYLEIEQIAAHETPPFPRFEASRERSPEAWAQRLRKDWQLGDDPIPNLQQLLENKGVKIFEIDTDNEKFDGFSAVCGDAAFLVIASWLKKDLPRKRMTLAHELGHLLVAQDASFSEDEHEAFADAFASAFLMPRDTFSKMFGWRRSRVSLSELLPVKAYFGVSIAALMYRARVLELISESSFRQFCIVRNKLGWRKKEPGSYRGEESSSRFERLVKKSVQEAEISESKGAALLGVPLAKLRKELANAV